MVINLVSVHKCGFAMVLQWFSTAESSGTSTYNYVKPNIVPVYRASSSDKYLGVEAQ